MDMILVTGHFLENFEGFMILKMVAVNTETDELSTYFAVAKPSGEIIHSAQTPNAAREIARRLKQKQMQHSSQQPQTPSPSPSPRRPSSGYER